MTTISWPTDIISHSGLTYIIVVLFNSVICTS